jgi:hypothetical protein
MPDFIYHVRPNGTGWRWEIVDHSGFTVASGVESTSIAARISALDDALAMAGTPVSHMLLQ